MNGNAPICSEFQDLWAARALQEMLNVPRSDKEPRQNPPASFCPRPLRGPRTPRRRAPVPGLEPPTTPTANPCPTPSRRSRRCVKPVFATLPSSTFRDTYGAASTTTAAPSLADSSNPCCLGPPTPASSAPPCAGTPAPGTDHQGNPVSNAGGRVPRLSRAGGNPNPGLTSHPEPKEALPPLPAPPIRTNLCAVS